MFPTLERFFTWIDHLLTRLTFQQKFVPVTGPAIWIWALLIYFVIAGSLIPKLITYHPTFKIIGYSLLLLVLNGVYLFYYRERISGLGFKISNWKRFASSSILSFIIPNLFLLLVALSIFLLIHYFLGITSNEYRFTVEKFAEDPNQAFLVLLQFLILAPIAEEIFFRGFVYSSMRRKMGPFLGGYLSAIIFSLAHVTMPLEDLFGNIVSLNFGLPLGPFLLGWFNAHVYERSGSLWVVIILHSALNLTGPLVQVFCPFMLDFLSFLYM